MWMNQAIDDNSDACMRGGGQAINLEGAKATDDDMRTLQETAAEMGVGVNCKRVVVDRYFHANVKKRFVVLCFRSDVAKCFLVS